MNGLRLVLVLMVSFSFLGISCKGDNVKPKKHSTAVATADVNGADNNSPNSEIGSAKMENTISQQESSVPNEENIETKTSKEGRVNAIDKVKEVVKEEVVNKSQPSKTATVVNEKVKTEVINEYKEVKEVSIVKSKEEVVESAKAEKSKEVTTADSKKSGNSEKSKETPVSDMHLEFDKILKTHVSSSGKVNYKGIKGDKDRLENYLALVSNNEPKANAERNEKLAYWINVYNAYTIKLIVDNYPINSITDLEGGKPWDKKWIKIGSQTYSLNHIENEIIRPQFKEPRIHFAVNCAAKSCPPISNRAWKASSLEADLEKAAKAFINNSAYNKFNNGKAQVSKIFEWYKEDFGDLKAYLSKYSGQEVKEISYAEYNWSLNN